MLRLFAGSQLQKKKKKCQVARAQISNWLSGSRGWGELPI